MAIQPNRMIISIICTTVFLGLFGVMNSSIAHETSRYTMIETESGVIRLDQQLGTITNCKKIADKWACTPVDNPETSDLNSTDRQELTRLRKENLKLRDRITALEQNPSYKPDLPQDNKDRDRKLKLPSDKEVDEAIDYMERMIKKFGGAIKRLKEQNKQEDGTEL